MHRARSLLEGKTGVAPITRFDASEFPTTFAAQIKDFDNEGCGARPVGPAGGSAHCSLLLSSGGPALLSQRASLALWLTQPAM